MEPGKADVAVGVIRRRYSVQREEVNFAASDGGTERCQLTWAG